MEIIVCKNYAFFWWRKRTHSRFGICIFRACRPKKNEVHSHVPFVFRRFFIFYFIIIYFFFILSLFRFLEMNEKRERERERDGETEGENRFSKRKEKKIMGDFANFFSV